MCPFSIAKLVYRSVTGMILQVVESPPLVPHRLTSPMTSPPFATKAAASAGARPKPIPRAMPRAPGLPGLKRQGGRPIPKDPFVCSFRKGFPLSSYSGYGIQTIPTLGRRLESLPGILVLMAEILLISCGSLSDYLQGYIHPRWCRISSITAPIGSMGLVCLPTFRWFLW